MIIYGVRTAKVRSGYPGQAPCPNCHNSGTIAYDITQRYFHVFWIPVFPLKKKIVSGCKSCHFVTELKQMPNVLKEDALRAKSQVRTPFYLFSFLIIIAVGVPFAVYNINASSKAPAERINDPKPGDVYSLKEEKDFYYLKLVSAKPDSLFFIPSVMQYNLKASLKVNTKTQDFFNEEMTLGYSRKEIKEMHENNTIRSVTRD